MAKKTRTELSTLALNTNLPDNTTEQITPTTERSQLTDERESVVNYKDDLGGATNAGKFLTVATDGESLTMVDEPSGVPDWVTFLSRSMRLFTSAASSNATIEWTYLNALDVLTIGAAIDFSESSKYLQIKNEFSGETITLTGGDIIFKLEADQLFRIRLLELTHYGDDFNMIAQDVFGASPLYNLNFKGRIDSSSSRPTFSSISGGKENATEDDKAGFLSFKTGIADGTLTERLRISSGGVVIKQTSGATHLALKLWNNSTTGDSRFLRFFTEATEAYRGSIQYDRLGDRLGIYGGSNGLLFGGLATFSNGIKFGGTPSPDYDVAATTLDAYEEGTWVAILSDGTTDATMETASNTYTRIGNLVYLNFTVYTSSIVGLSGNLQIKGLPYQAGAGSAPVGIVTSSANQFLNVTAGQFVSGRIGATANTIELWLNDTASGMSNMQASEWSSNGYANFLGYYKI